VTEAAPVLERLLPDSSGAIPASPVKTWLDLHGLPTGREEAWRYTPVDDIKTALEGAVLADPVAVAVDADFVDAVAGDHGGVRLVYVNGVHAPELSRSAPMAPGVTWESGPALAELPAGVGDQLRYDGFQALNQLSAPESVTVRIAAGTDVAEPIHLVHLNRPAADQAVVTQPRTTVEVGAGARVTLIETYAGLEGPTVVNASTTIAVGEGADVTHHRVQAEGAGVIHVGHTRIDQHADSQIHSLSVMLGGIIARHELDLTLAGTGAHADLHGLYLPAGRQRHDNVITVDHAASRCTSTQMFKGVMADDGRGSFGGHVIVRSDTVGTDARQSNRNLVLSRRAQADTRPWLEIFADDVKCTHGATVGRLDDEALFYLRTRGIAEDEARSMLITAFVEEIIEGVALESLREHLDAAVAARMGGAR
jgi:Fe-S cluster assembly protein SufD